MPGWRPKVESGDQVELIVINSWSSSTPSALRYRARNRALATIRSRHRSPATTAVGAASGQLTRSASNSRALVSAIAVGMSRPRKVSSSRSSPVLDRVGVPALRL
jgi:hypothetical protein